MEHVTLLTASVAVFVLPGYALTRLVLRAVPMSLTERLAISTAVSLVVFPLLLLFGTSIGLQLGPTVVVAIGALSAGPVAWDAFHQSRQRKTSLSLREAFSLEELLLLMVFVVTLALRLATVHGQSYPPWTDGYHHTLIAQIIRDTGFIPEGYRPYAPIDRFTYHFGFHSVVAAWAWLTGLATPKATLLVAQVINALSVLTIYVFARTLTRRKDIGLFSAVVVGLISVMPAYYVNWSRSTQLMAQVILPAALVCLVQVLEPPAHHRRWATLGGILLAGLFLAHYAVWLFVLVFVIVYVLTWIVGNGHEAAQRWRQLPWLLGCGLAGAVLVSPWMWHVVRTFLLPKHIVPEDTLALTPEEVRQSIAMYYAPVSLDWFGSHVLRPVQAVAAYLGTLFGMTGRADGTRAGASPPPSAAQGDFAARFSGGRQQRAVLCLLLWFGALFLLATPDWSGLPPQFALYNNFAVAIALYLVASVFMALLVVHVIDWLSAWWHAAGPVLMVGFTLVACALAWRWQPTLLEATRVYVTPADEAAAAWIRDNLPPDATLAVRPHFENPVEVIGVDGGYWLPYLAGRQVTVPPMVYYAEGDPTYANEVLALSKALLAAQSMTELADLLRAHGIDYVYVGPQRPDDLRQLLLSAPQFQVVYDRDGATVLRRQ